MSRASRFDKLETPRADRPKEGSRVSEERFADAPARSPEAPSEAPVPATERSVESPAGPPTPQLERFAADGANHLSLDNDELVRLPFRRCPACERDSSKFDRSCIFCGASLETAEAREFNLTILAGFDAEKAKALAEQRAQHEASLKQLVDEEFAKQVEAQREATLRERLGTKAGLAGAAVGCFAIALWARSFCASGALFVLGLALLVAVLPRGVLEVLGRPMRRRFRL